MKVGSLLSCRQIAVYLCVTVMALVFSGCASSPEAKSAKRMAAGKRLLEKKDVARAILEFKSAARVMPKDPEVYYQLGVAYLGAQDYRSAILAFRKAIELNPKHVASQLRMAQILSQTNDKELLTNAQDRLKTLLDEPSATPEMLNTLAFTQLKLGDPENAIQSLERALAQSPGELTASLLLARTKLTAKDVKGAEEVLKKACNAVPQSSEVHRFLGGFYVNQQRMSEAEAQYRQALQIDPKNAPALMDLARFQRTTGQKQNAEQTLKQAAAFEQFKSVYALFLFEEGRHKEAIQEFTRLAELHRDDRQVRTHLVAAYQLANRPAEAERVLDNALRKNPKDLDALLQRGEIFLSAGKYQQAEADLNQILHLQPDSAEGHYILAKLHLARHEDLSYRKELSECLRLNSYLLPVRLELAQNLTGTNVKAALDLLDAAPDSQKQLTAVVVQRNWAFWTAKHFQEMRKGVDQGLSRERSTDLLLQDAVLKLQAGNFSGAQRILEEALKLDPTDLRALAALNNAFAAQKQPRIAIQKVKEYAAAQPKSAPAQELLGLVLLANGDRAQARSAFLASKAADPKYVRAEFDLIGLDVLESRWEDARSKLTGILAANPENLPARLWLADVEAMKGELDSALNHYRMVVDRNPHNKKALNNLAYLLAVHAKQPDQALKYAEKAMELAPADPDFADTLGWVLYQKGLYTLAVQYLERAASNKGNVVWKYHLAMAYAKAGKRLDAKTTLDAALRTDAKAPEAESAMAVVNSTR